MRILALTVGNTTIACALFVNGSLRKVVRQSVSGTSEAMPLSAKTKRALGRKADAVALTSVVPALTAPLVRQIEAFVGVKPKLLTAMAAHGLTIGYREPQTLGADRVAAAIGARLRYPGRNVIVVDCGTASTVTALSKRGRILGGAILPGVGLWSDMLHQRTAQLPKVAGAKPKKAIGRSPAEGIASGIHFGHAGALRELIARIRKEAFGKADCLVLATGGNAEPFSGEHLFDRIEPNLVVKGLAAFAQRD